MGFVDGFLLYYDCGGIYSDGSLLQSTPAGAIWTSSVRSPISVFGLGPIGITLDLPDGFHIGGIPEPSTWMLLVCGFALRLLYERRRADLPVRWAALWDMGPIMGVPSTSERWLQ
jgi:hypothetical protein